MLVEINVKWMLLRASYFKLKWFLYLSLYSWKQIRVRVVAFLFPRLYYTFIFMLLSPVYRERRKKRRSFFLFLPSSFSYHLSPFFSLNKNTPNPFWDMLRIRSNRLFFFLSPPVSGYKQNASLSLTHSLTHPLSTSLFPISLSLSLFHTHTYAFRLYTHAHTRTHTDASVCAF